MLSSATLTILAPQSVLDADSDRLPPPDHYQCYTVEVSNDNATWTKIIDKVTINLI